MLDYQSYGEMKGPDLDGFMEFLFVTGALDSTDGDEEDTDDEDD